MARQSEVGVKQTEPITVAYDARKRSFATIGEEKGARFGWIAKQG